jgi:hypothetical protein
MSANKSDQKGAVNQTIKETADCIYERLRFQVTRIGSAAGSNSHVFFVFGASVDLIYSNSIEFYRFYLG